MKFHFNEPALSMGFSKGIILVLLRSDTTEKLMQPLDILGLIATCFTTYSFVPQVWRTWKTRDVSGISLSSYLIITVGLFLWLVYGYLKGDLPLMVANSVMVVLTAAITIMKLRFTEAAITAK